MSKISNIILSITTIAGLFLTSCDQSELDTYSGRNDIYFKTGTTANADKEDKISILHLGYDNKKDSIITIETIIIGDVTDYDRPINFGIVDSLSTAKLGKDVELLYDKSYVKANSNSGQISVRLIETPESDKSKIKLTFKLLPNEYFLAQYVYDSNTNKDINWNLSQLYFDSSNDMPILWADAQSYFNRLFGQFSKVKYKFICETLNFPEELFSYDPAVEKNPRELAEARFPSLASFSWIMLLNRSLKDYETAHGEKLKDENGALVTFPFSFS